MTSFLIVKFGARRLTIHVLSNAYGTNILAQIL